MLLAIAVALGQLQAVAAAWAGGFAPDPFALLVAHAGLRLRPGALVPAALALGLGRALVLAEPAGGHVLCAAAALALVAGVRSGLERGSPASLAAAALLVAGCWWACGAFLEAISGAPVGAGAPLALGALLAWPVVAAAGRLARLRGRLA